MEDLIAQERFEIEVLERLNSGRFLDRLLFGGGTMLRLCHDLDRFSVDLDFWLAKPDGAGKLYQELADYLGRLYDLRDAADKHYTLLFEISAPRYPRRLKIEIRKEAFSPLSEPAIAFSPYAARQIHLRAVPLGVMMSSKIAAFLSRGEIRDAYDMEFLVMKGIAPSGERERLLAVSRGIDLLSRQDYAVKLGSLLAADKRGYYVEKNFRILQEALQKATATGSGADRAG